MYVDNTTVYNLYAIIILLFYLRVSFVLMFFFYICILCLWIVHCSVCTSYALIFLILLQPASIVFLISAIHDKGPEN